MAKKRTTQIQILEQTRGERGMTQTAFCRAIDVSRMWYYKRLNQSDGDVLDLKSLSEMALWYIGEWRSDMAVQCIRLMDERFVPCVCQTEVGDNGPCPKHPLRRAAAPPPISSKLEEEVTEVMA